MKINTAGLDAFRPDAPKSPAAKKAAKKPTWFEPTLADFPARARALCVDQSLGALGLVYLAVDDGVIEVRKSVSFTGDADPAATGWEKDLQETENLRQKLTEEFRGIQQEGGWTLYHEAPPLGGRITHPESSLLASAALRAAVVDAGLARGPMIQPQSWKRLTINVPNATKVEIKKLLIPFAARLPVKGLEAVTNEAQRDALGVGLASLVRIGRAGS
jgi:hypothetical protein